MQKNEFRSARLIKRSWVWVLTAVAVGMSLSIGVAYSVYLQGQRDSQEHFAHQVDALEISLKERFAQPLDGLNAMAGLFNATPHMDRTTFNRFWQNTDLKTQYPGVRSFGFLQPVKRDAITVFEAAQRADGAPNFTVKTKGDLPDLHVVRFIATIADANVSLGVDVNTEQVRRVALAEASRTGQPTLSSSIRLLAQQGESKPGFLYFKTIYNGQPAPSNLQGTLLATLVLEDLMAYTLSMASGLAAFELLDDTVLADNTSQRAVIFDSENPRQYLPLNSLRDRYLDARFTQARELKVAGHSMLLRARSTAAFDTAEYSVRPAAVAVAGTLLTLFSTLLIWLLVRGRDYAQSRADAISSQNERLVRAVQLTNNSVIIADANNNVDWANAAFSHISGLPLTEVMGKNAATLRGLDVTSPEAVAKVRTALKQGKDVRVQTFGRTPQGREYWLDTDVQVLKSPQGDYAGYLAVETDITDEKKRVQSLNAALQETQALMDAINVHAIVSQADGNGTITHVNDEFCSISGYTREELIGQDHRMVNSGVHSLAFWKEFWDTISMGLPWRGEVCNRAKDGSLYWVDSMIAPFIGNEGQVEKYVSIRMDITAGKRAQDNLRGNAQLLEESQRIAKVGGWELDLQKQKLYWTAETYRIHQTSPDEFDPTVDAGVGFYLPDSQVLLSQALEAAMATGQGYDLELETYTTKGTRIDVRTTCTVTMDGGKPVRLTGIFQDITERKQYERTLHEARVKAEEATQSKGQFLANMSHEIRTPMNAILGMLSLLQYTTMSARQSDYANKAEGAARSLLGLINDILDFSKVEAGKMTLDPQPFRLNQLMHELSVILSTNVRVNGIEVLYDIDPALPEVVLGDSMRLQQILINLGGNAVKFTTQGQIVIAVHAKPRGADADAKSVAVEFAVQDSGIGIAPENQARIFTGFSQAEASTSRKFGGTGLGLAISQRLVSMMGGTLQLRSALGAGSTFFFELDMPLVHDVPPELQHSAMATVAPRRVLVVDDNPIAAKLIENSVRSWGWPVEVADCGEQAMALVAQRWAGGAEFPFDVVYLDWQMPGIDGWQTAQQMRDACSKGNGKQPVIVMVSSSSRETLAQRTEAEQNLINGFVVKPATASMLQEAALESISSEARMRQARRNGSSNRRLTGMRILVVEDNLINQQVAEELLMSQGALVSLAADGRIGVNAVQAASPQFDVVLMDVQMPVMDGYTATRMLREELGFTSLPIIAMTANAMASDREACLAAGMNDHVGKPFDLSQLVKMLLKWTGKPGGGEVVPQVLANGAVSDAVFDVRGALTRMGGLERLYVRSLKDFAKFLPGLRGEFESLLATDLPRATMLVHTIKGTAATLGADRLSAVAAKLELLCKQDDAALVTEGELAVLDAHLHEAASALPQVLADLDPDAQSAGQAFAVVQDVAAIAAALSALEPLLQADDMTAMEVFAQVRSGLDSVQPDQLTALETAMQNLEFGDALRVCVEIKKALV